MEQQRQQPNGFRMNSSRELADGNVDEITHRLDQMNVQTTNTISLQPQQQQQQQHQSLTFDYTDEQMSIDYENVQPDGAMADDEHHHQGRHRAEQCSDSNILIVTNVDPNVFGEPLVRAKFESLFTAYDERVLFRYLKSFRRVRLDFSSAQAADAARLNLNNYQLGTTAFKCYLAQIIRPNGGANSANLNTDNLYDDRNIQESQIYNSDPQQQHQNNFYLSIPRQSKQFLISPPVSPPAGWKPHDESSPCIDVQLISAIANLVPGQVHEIHPGNESQPGIFVEVCEEKQYDSLSGGNRARIPKTANPIAAARAAIGQAMRSS